MLPKGTKIHSRDGKMVGTTTGSTRDCQMES
jgi:hypothetical protein